MRFHLHPAVKASRRSDGYGAMLVLPNKDVWTFDSHEDRVELEKASISAAPRAAADRATRDPWPRAPGAAGALDLHPYAAPACAEEERQRRTQEAAGRAGIAALTSASP